MLPQLCASVSGFFEANKPVHLPPFFHSPFLLFFLLLLSFPPMCRSSISVRLSVRPSPCQAERLQKQVCLWPRRQSFGGSLFYLFSVSQSVSQSRAILPPSKKIASAASIGTFCCTPIPTNYYKQWLFAIVEQKYQKVYMYIFFTVSDIFVCLQATNNSGEVKRAFNLSV